MNTMPGALDFLSEHWFSVLLLASALILGAALLNVWRRRREWSRTLLLSASAFAFLGVGGLVLPAGWGLWLVVAMLVLLFIMLLVVITTGSWSAILGYTVGGLLLLGLGGATCDRIAWGLFEAGKLLASLEPTQPWWLLLLGF